MNYELAKKLKDAGFPMPLSAIDERVREAFGENGKVYLFPTLSELIEACGKDFDSLEYVKQGTEEPSNTFWLEEQGRWIATASDEDGNTMEDIASKTPEEAVANLWLALQVKE